MGRSDVTATHTRVARWETELSFFLEPLLDPEGYNNPATPNTSTLAHEIFLRNWGQYSGDRLIPQHERIAGGLRTVRGYPQAFIAGDTVVISRGEYRLHIPRLFPINPDPIELPLIGKFRLFPQQVFGAPDWDLILRAFIDAAQVRQVDIQVGEENVDVIGLGLGLELQVKSNFIARFDWGNARTATADVAKGRNEFYFSVTLIF
jgi:hemolysin activation/secretion protein